MNALVTALTTIRRSPYQAITAILMVAVTFFVGYSFSLLLLGSSVVLKHFEKQPQIIAFFELKVEPQIVQEVAETMKKKPYVSDVRTIMKNDALLLYQEENKDDPLLLELVTADILPASVEVSGATIESLETIKNDLLQFDGVEDVTYQEDVFSKLSRWINTIEFTGIAITGVLTLISFLIIMVVIAMKASLYKKKITIMKMLGATKSYIVAPFMLEGMIYGFVGSLLGWVITFASFLYLTPMITQILEGISIFPIALELYVLHATAGIILGVLLGAFASMVAVQRFIKK